MGEQTENHVVVRYRKKVCHKNVVFLRNYATSQHFSLAIVFLPNKHPIGSLYNL